MSSRVERTDPLELVDRAAVLELLAEHLSEAWASFDRPRPAAESSARAAHS